MPAPSASLGLIENVVPDRQGERHYFALDTATLTNPVANKLCTSVLSRAQFTLDYACLKLRIRFRGFVQSYNGSFVPGFLYLRFHLATAGAILDYGTAPNFTIGGPNSNSTCSVVNPQPTSITGVAGAQIYASSMALGYSAIAGGTYVDEIFVLTLPSPLSGLYALIPVVHYVSSSVSTTFIVNGTVEVSNVALL